MPIPAKIHHKQPIPFGVFLTLLGGFGPFLGQKPVILEGLGQKNVWKP